MYIQKGRHLARLLSSLAATALITSLAHAQEVPDAPALEDDPSVIVVTAQKRDERLLDVPVPVTAVDADTLIQQNLVELQDYASRIPGLSVSGNQTNDISLRGITAGGGASPTVAVTIDDVPFGSSSWAGKGVFPDLDPSDLQRIEVLRGPQGTLYGASSLGGLIKFVTNDPDPNDFSGRAEVGYSDAEGGGDGYSVRGAVNIPIAEDMLALRVSGFHREEPPLIDLYDRETGEFVAEDVDRSETEGYRAALLFRPVDILTINVARLEQKTKGRNSSSTLLDPFPTTYDPVYGYFTSDSGPSRSSNKIELTTVHADLDLDFATLSSISGWGRISSFIDSDVTRGFSFVFEGIPGLVPPIYPDAPADAQVRLNDASRTRKFSQEIRLTSNGGGAVDWLIGGFYTKENTLLAQDLTANDSSGGLIGPVIEFPLPSTFKETAVFGDLTYYFTDKFDVQVGARYSKNEQTYQANQTVAQPAVPLFGPSRDGEISRSSDDAFTWLVTPRYKINEDLMVYGRVATGYRPGGPNTATAPRPTFDPDTVTNYELGIKGRVLDRMLTIDASLFQIDWNDIQLQAQAITGVAFLTNGGNARSRGIEAAAQLSPGGGWVISANMTLNEAELREALPIDPAGGASLLGEKGDPLPYAPTFSGNIGVEKSWDVFGDFQFTLGGNLSHVGERDTLFRLSSAPASRQVKLRAPSYNVIDLRATLGNDDWEGTIFVRNLGSERGIINVGDGQGNNSSTSATFIEPQTVGITVSRRF